MAGNNSGKCQEFSERIHELLEKMLKDEIERHKGKIERQEQKIRMLKEEVLKKQEMMEKSMMTMGERVNEIKESLPKYPSFMEISPITKASLQIMEQKPNESFREYALRWRDLAIQVQPPLTEEETPRLFLETLKTPLYKLLIVGGVGGTGSFADIVIRGEMIEWDINNGKIEALESVAIQENDS